MTIYSYLNNDLKLIIKDKHIDLKSKEIELIEDQLVPKIIINKVIIDQTKFRRGDFYFIDNVTETL